MTDLIQDIWHDLREKRLWPVAVGLVVAIVAIPAVLTKSAAQPAASGQLADAPPPAPERSALVLDGGDAASSAVGSSLDHFAASDPFVPPRAIAKGARVVGARAGAATARSSDTTPGADGGKGGSPSGGEAPRAQAPPAQLRPPTTTAYQYVADVTFWNGDRKRRVRGLRKLDMLPNAGAPVLIFMGTTGEGGDAVFLLDSQLSTAGEGRCVPGPGNCAYVHLGAGAEQAFTTEQGDSYRIRVDEIRRVKIGAGASAARRSVARTADVATRPFELPTLVDLVAVTTGGAAEPGDEPAPATDSSPQAAGR